MVSGAEYVNGLAIVAILLLAILIIYRNKQKAWILAAIFIGLASVPIGLYMYLLGIGYQTLSVLISVIILSKGYAVIRKDPKIFLKIFLIAFLVSVIAFMGLFFASGSESGLYVKIQKISTVEENSTYSDANTLKEEELNKYPGIKRAIDECVNSNKCTSKVDKSEWEIRKLRVFPYAKINDTYYSLSFYSSD